MGSCIGDRLMNTLFNNYQSLVNEKVIVENRQRDKMKQPKISRVFDDGLVIERMMRCGIEARLFEPNNNDELKEIAVITLVDDQTKKY